MLPSSPKISLNLPCNSCLALHCLQILLPGKDSLHQPDSEEVRRKGSVFPTSAKNWKHSLFFLIRGGASVPSCTPPFISSHTWDCLEINCFTEAYTFVDNSLLHHMLSFSVLNGVVWQKKSCESQSSFYQRSSTQSLLPKRLHNMAVIFLGQDLFSNLSTSVCSLINQRTILSSPQYSQPLPVWKQSIQLPSL